MRQQPQLTARLRGEGWAQ